MDESKLDKIIKQCHSEIDKTIEFQIKDQELQNLLQMKRKRIDTQKRLSLDENVKFFEKKDKIFHAKQQQVFKKIQEEVEQINQSDPSLFEIIFRQKLHSASRFENVEYNIPSILDYVSGDQ